MIRRFAAFVDLDFHCDKTPSFWRSDRIQTDRTITLRDGLFGAVSVLWNSRLRFRNGSDWYSVISTLSNASSSLYAIQRRVSRRLLLRGCHKHQGGFKDWVEGIES